MPAKSCVFRFPAQSSFHTLKLFPAHSLTDPGKLAGSGHQPQVSWGPSHSRVGQDWQGRREKQTERITLQTPAAPWTGAPALNVDSRWPEVLLRGNKIIGQLASGQKKTRSVDWETFYRDSVVRRRAAVLCHAEEGTGLPSECGSGWRV